MTRRVFVVVLLFVSLGLLAGAISPSWAQAPPAPRPEKVLPDPEVLGEGPLHEAFAEPLTLDLAERPVIAKQPPQAVIEIPPDARPEGKNMEWIPGYFMWDQDRNDFVWVSGLWRDVPPGRRWIPGEWQEADRGWIWVHGFWADQKVDRQALLPIPPDTLDQGPSSPAPDDNYIWAPGCWVWQQTGYAWQAGYWYQGNPNWVWVPSHYTYTPGGCFFVSGYWDYPPVHRAVMYAPVYWGNGFAGYGGTYYYRPVSVINTGLLVANLFVHSGHHHYYFGYGYNNYPHYLQPWGHNYSHWGNHHDNHLVHDPWWSYYRCHNDRDFDNQGHWKYANNWNRPAHHEHAGVGPNVPQNGIHQRDRVKNLVTTIDHLKKEGSQTWKVRDLNATEISKIAKHSEQYRNFDRSRIGLDQHSQIEAGNMISKGTRSNLGRGEILRQSDLNGFSERADSHRGQKENFIDQAVEGHNFGQAGQTNNGEGSTRARRSGFAHSESHLPAEVHRDRFDRLKSTPPIEGQTNQQFQGQAAFRNRGTTSQNGQVIIGNDPTDVPNQFQGRSRFQEGNQNAQTTGSREGAWNQNPQFQNFEQRSLKFPQIQGTTIPGPSQIQRGGNTWNQGQSSFRNFNQGNSNNQGNNFNQGSNFQSGAHQGRFIQQQPQNFNQNQSRSFQGGNNQGGGGGGHSEGGGGHGHKD